MHGQLSKLSMLQHIRKEHNIDENQKKMQLHDLSLQNVANPAQMTIILNLAELIETCGVRFRELELDGDALDSV